MVEFVSSGDKFKTLKPTPSELSPDVVRTTVELTWENLEKLPERVKIESARSRPLELHSTFFFFFFW